MVVVWSFGVVEVDGAVDVVVPPGAEKLARLPPATRADASSELDAVNSDRDPKSRTAGVS